MNKNILKVSSSHREWSEGYIHGEDAQCFVVCKCGETLSVSDYEIVKCKCGIGYITEFSCYRISADALRLLNEV